MANSETLSDRVDIIIPTSGLRSRALLLERAITSVLTQDSVQARPIVILNGQGYDASVRRMLESRGDITFRYQHEGNVAQARAYGRSLVQAPYFGFLDDDDYLIVNSCARRIDALTSCEHADAVVSAGYLANGDQRSLIGAHRDGIADDPIAALLSENWLTNAGGLYRTDRIGEEFFDHGFVHMEWTITALFLVQRRTLVFDKSPSFVEEKQVDSASKSLRHVYDHEKAIRYMLSMSLPPHVRKALLYKYTTALNLAANAAALEGKMGLAWRYHLRCLAAQGGWRYLGATRHFIGRRR